MTHYAKGRAIPLLLLGLSLVAVSSQAQIEQLSNKRYDCQVTTSKDRQGYVAVMAESMEAATALARNAREAATRLATREPTREVVQCVELPDGRFTDADFQSWVNQLPR
jgi:hypothetical protein